MSKSPREVIENARAHNVQLVDLKFCNLFGGWHHLTLPISQFSEELFVSGEGFDGSSIPGFAELEAGDLVAIPDPETAFIDPFWDMKTLSLICDIAVPGTLERYDRDPRRIARKAEEYLKQTGIADDSRWGPEFEFHIFENVSVKNGINEVGYRIDAAEAEWHRGDDGANLGNIVKHKGGYHIIPPHDVNYNLRSEMVRLIEEMGIPVRYHHHEVGGPAQSEIEVKLTPLLRAADLTMQVKYVTKMAAQKAGKVVTFMPKPLHNEAGNGMHFHQLLLKGGKPVFFDEKGYAGLSQTALWYIGGLLTHAPALLGLTNPSSNSYKRLVPGFEAPVQMFFGLANRAAAIRIPKYANAPLEKRFEFRPPDATANVYLAIAAQMMAGIDGIKKQIDPTKAGFGPFDQKLSTMPPEELAKIRSLPTTLDHALDALEKDFDFLLEGGVFTEEMVRGWIKAKRAKDAQAIRNRPHPYEYELYFDC